MDGGRVQGVRAGSVVTTLLWFSGWPELVSLVVVLGAPTAWIVHARRRDTLGEALDRIARMVEGEG